MSDSSNDREDASILGKRDRNEENSESAEHVSKKMTVDEDSDDDDVGPMPMPADAPGVAKRKRKGVFFRTVWACAVSHESCLVLPHERLYLEHVPNTNQYYKSFMHRDSVNFCVMTKCVAKFPFTISYLSYFPTRMEFLITTSVDGILKLWKKQENGIEFVKVYRAHLTPVTAVSASADGQLFATVSEDMTAKVFDVVNFGKNPSVFRTTNLSNTHQI